MERWILLKDFYYMTIQYNRFYHIIEFIGIYEWIHSFACIFKDIGDVQLICMLREKNLFQIFFVIFLRCTKNEESWNSEMFSIHEGLKCACFPKIRMKISFFIFPEFHRTNKKNLCFLYIDMRCFECSKSIFSEFPTQKRGGKKLLHLKVWIFSFLLHQELLPYL